MKIDPRTGFPVLEFNEDEDSLDKIEESWADCAAGFRSTAIYRQTRKDGRLSIRGEGLIGVHEQLEDQRQDYERGDTAALYNVLRQCLQENLPLPYWASAGLLKVMDRVDKEPGLSLHAAIGLEKRYPIQKTRAQVARRDWDVAVQLWGLVRAHPDYKPFAPNTKPIRDVLKANPQLPFCPRKADEKFKMVDRIQARAIRTSLRSR